MIPTSLPPCAQDGGSTDELKEFEGSYRDGLRAVIHTGALNGKEREHNMETGIIWWSRGMLDAEA